MAYDTDRERKMRRMQEVSFTADEARLYLRAHPDDTKATAYCRKLDTQLQRLTEEYINEYGPLPEGGALEMEDFPVPDDPWADELTEDMLDHKHWGFSDEECSWDEEP